MNFEDDSAICLYIDELKSDDQSLKLNAVEKIPLICETLSEERICQEFFPYLKYIIQECDNEDEFLMKVCENILKFLAERTSTGGEVLAGSIQVFEPMVIMEDSRVRNAGLTGLLFVSRFQFSQVSEIILKLGTSDLVYAKISSCRLISQTIREEMFDGQLFAACSKICLLMFTDQNMLVKRSSVAAILAMWSLPVPQDIASPQTILSEGFLNELANKYIGLQDDGLSHELMNRDFLTKFFSLLSQKRTTSLKLVLFEKFIGLLQVNKTPINNLNPEHEQAPMHLVDRKWKVKYMFAKNLDLLLSDLDFSDTETIARFEEFLLKQTQLMEELDISSINQEETDQTACWTKIVQVLCGVYRLYMTDQMMEVRSVLFCSLVRLCQNQTQPLWQLLLLRQLIVIVNNFVLSETSFYVKMKVSLFLASLVEISVTNSHLQDCNMHFESITKTGAVLTEVRQVPPNSIEKSDRAAVETVHLSASELITRNTVTGSSPLHAAALAEYAYQVFDILSLDRSLEVLRFKIVFVQRVMQFVPKSASIKALFRRILGSLKDSHNNTNIKFREQTLLLLKFLVSRIEISVVEGIALTY